MAKLPTITSNIPRDVRTYLDRVREAMNGNGLDDLVTARQLVAAGIAQYNGGLTLAPGEVVAGTPLRPTNVEASGAFANIMITWDKPAYQGHSYAEIWAATQTEEQEAAGENPTLGQAELVGMAPGQFFAHNVGNAAVFWYWVRFVNVLGVAGPYNATEGTRGETSPDPAYLLELLTGQITEGQLYQDLQTRIGQIDVLGTQITEVQTVIDGEIAQLTETISAAVDANTALIQNETTARVQADSAEATARQNLAATVGNVSAALQEEKTVRADETGDLFGQYTVKIDLDGYVTGYGLASSVVDGVPTSEFIVRADSFAIGAPGVPAVGYMLPFVVQSTPTTINGESVPAGVYMNDAFIVNGSITNAKIADAAIDNAKIVELDAGKINTGFLDAERIEAGTIDADKIDTRNLTIKDSLGNILFGSGYNLAAGNVDGLGALATQDTVDASNVDNLGALATQDSVDATTQVSNLAQLAFKDSVGADDIADLSTYIAGASIDFAQINDSIYSSTYQSGSSGWRLFKDGSAELNDATFRGQLDVQSASSGSRLEIDGDQIRVYEGNTLRVVLGRL